MFFVRTRDTEVLLALYLEHGTALLEKLNGIYALCDLGRAFESTVCGSGWTGGQATLFQRIRWRFCIC